jgi:hypothetical protein
MQVSVGQLEIDPLQDGENLPAFADPLLLSAH